MKRAKKPKKVTVWRWWILTERTAPPVVALGAMVMVILLTLAFHLLTKPAAAPTVTKNTKTLSTANLSINTNDGITLAGNLTYPSGAGPFPAVILVHEFGEDHHQWDAYRDTFIGDGFAVLAYDTRGFGESAIASIPTGQTGFFSSMPNDLTAVVAHLRTQRKIDGTRIFVVGASLGANIAYVAAGSDLGITKTVLLSPGVNPQLDGSSVANFKPTNIFGLATTVDQAALEGLMAKVQEPKKTSLITTSADHGIELLQSSDVFNAVRQWLME